jgi:hypothetical protein
MANGTQTVSAVITADAKPFKRSVQDAGRSFDGFSKAAQGFGIAAAAAFAVATAAAVSFVTESVKAAAQSEAVARGLQNAAENAGVFAEQAGGIAGVTDELQTFAKQLGETIGLDDEKILGIVSQWLAVPQLAQLGVGGLKNLVKVAADVAAGTNKDLDTIATAFVKVAGDGETALSKLLRAGIVFTDEQKAVYQSLLDSNDELGAQQYLIDTLGKKYDGAAAAIANPFDRISQIFQNFQEEIGKRLLPSLDLAIPQLQTFFDNIVSDPEFIGFLEDLVTQFQNMGVELEPLLPQLFDLAKVIIPTLAEFIPIVTRLFAALGGAVDDTSGAVDFFTQWIEWSYTPLLTLVGLIEGLATGFKNTTDEAKAFLKFFQDNNIFDILGPLQNLLNPPNVAGGGGGGGGGGGVGPFNPGPIYADDRRPNLSSTYNINVNAIAPSAEVGRAVVDSIRNYQRAGGAV